MKTYVDVSHILGWKGILTGIERVEYHLIRHYKKQGGAIFVYWDSSEKEFLQLSEAELASKVLDVSIVNKDMKKASSKILIKAASLFSPIRKVSMQEEDSLIVLAGLWDSTDYAQYISSTKARVIHIVYDMIPIVQPSYVVDFVRSVFLSYMRIVMPNVSHALSISKATQDDLIQFLRQESIKSPKLDTFRLGDDPFKSVSGIKPGLSIPSNYYLSVGTIEARKNHALLYYAYKNAISQGIDLPALVIAGRRGWLSGDIQHLIEQDLEIKKKIIIIDSINDEELTWLYKNCLLTIFPSFYEGWGLPVAESLMSGKVTLASNCSSIPEVGRSNVDYFSPFSPDGLLELLVKYSDKSARQKRERKLSYIPTSWEETGHDFSNKVVSGYSS